MLPLDAHLREPEAVGLRILACQDASYKAAGSVLALFFTLMSIVVPRMSLSWFTCEVVEELSKGAFLVIIVHARVCICTHITALFVTRVS